MHGFAAKSDHHSCKSRESNGDLRGCAENFARFHEVPFVARKCALTRRKVLPIWAGFSHRDIESQIAVNRKASRESLGRAASEKPLRIRLLGNRTAIAKANKVLLMFVGFLVLSAALSGKAISVGVTATFCVFDRCASTLAAISWFSL
jgi:hypothetical protein